MCSVQKSSSCFQIKTKLTQRRIYTSKDVYTPSLKFEESKTS